MTHWNSLSGVRGVDTENLIMLANHQYELLGSALIKKNAVPVKVLALDRKGRIVSGYFEDKAIVDYSGISHGLSIAFDAKETDETSLPLKNIKKHQIEYMEQHSAQGGCSFLIVNWKTKGTFFVVPVEVVSYYFWNSFAGGRKSIPYTSMCDAVEIKYKPGGTIEYLSAVHKYKEMKDNCFFMNYKKRQIV